MAISLAVAMLSSLVMGITSVRRPVHGKGEKGKERNGKENEGMKE